ncbi:NUDIX domain-containing protein [Kribbella sp. NBC_01510]
MDGDRLLLTRRSDNGEWCLPGGGVAPGERPAEGDPRPPVSGGVVGGE